MAQHYTSLEGVTLANSWLTIGSFDGVHIGHQELIRGLIKEANINGGKSVVLTFHPHPSVVLRGRTDAFYLTTAAEKAELLDNLGPDVVVTHPFNYETSQSSARDFVFYLNSHLDFKQLWVGLDFALGKGREGNVEFLKNLGSELDFKVQVVEQITASGEIVSSSQIRKYLLAGEVEDAAKLLGRPYQLAGVVVHGDGRGKTIGIPTANLDTGKDKLIPGAGVYACRAIVKDNIRPAAVNIGTRPTFDSPDKRSHVEAHLLDYDEDLYSQSMTLDFISRLRGEQRFNSVGELIDQINLDIEKTRQIVLNIPN